MTTEQFLKSAIIKVDENYKQGIACIDTKNNIIIVNPRYNDLDIELKQFVLLYLKFSSETKPGDSIPPMSLAIDEILTLWPNRTLGFWVKGVDGLYYNMKYKKRLEMFKKINHFFKTKKPIQ